VDVRRINNPMPYSFVSNNHHERNKIEETTMEEGNWRLFRKRNLLLGPATAGC
jgi:hypothetical protein